jgi:hypothetical protein
MKLAKNLVAVRHASIEYIQESLPAIIINYNLRMLAYLFDVDPEFNILLLDTKRDDGTYMYSYILKKGLMQHGVSHFEKQYTYYTKLKRRINELNKV